MTLSANERAHARDDHSACGADTDCHEIWLAELAKAGEYSVIQAHTSERHFCCPPSWLCHQDWKEAQMEEDARSKGVAVKVEQQSQMTAPLEADGGGRVEATVQHQMRGFVEQAVHHDHNGTHPLVLEVREGDILLLPSHTGTDWKADASLSDLAEVLGADAIYTSRRISTPFILRKADDE